MLAKTILVIGTKRSGHHAIIGWLARQMPETVVHHNDVDAEKLSVGRIAYFGGIKETIYNGNHLNKAIYSFEDISLNKIEEIEQRFETTTIVVLRDIRNTLASLIKSTPLKHIRKRLEASTKAWHEYAYDFISGQYTNRKYILYDKWFENEHYRYTLCSDFNITFTDAGLNIVSKNANGSSFDHMRYQGNAQGMDVLNRWKAYNNNRYFKEFYTDELKETNSLVFNNDRS